MQVALPLHDEILRKAIAAHGGEVFKTGGDAFNAVFPRPSDAIGAAIDAQQALAHRDWSAIDGLAVRMAVHVGTAEKREADRRRGGAARADRIGKLRKAQNGTYPISDEIGGVPRFGTRSAARRRDRATCAFDRE